MRLARFLLCAFAVAAYLVSAGSVARAATRESWERGKLLYTDRCIFCHGQDGSGWNLQTRVPRPPVPVPNLTDPVFMKKFTDKDLFKVIKEGGTRKGKSRFMPPAGRWLNGKDIRDVIAYVRSLVRSRPGGKR